MKNVLLISIISMISHCLVLSQDYKDCSSALVLCGDSPFMLQMTDGIGEFDGGLSDLCVQQEIGSTWLHITAETAGDIVFELDPADLEVDLDFVVFKMVDDDCDAKEAIRCMASGETAGQPSEACAGATGLAYGETDVVEMPGCSTGDNNFLAPLEVEAGDEFKILIMEFSQSNASIEMSIGGTATLACISTATEEAVAPLAALTVYPNPSTGTFTISSEASAEWVSIYDVQGRRVWEGDHSKEMTISSEQLGGAGVYHVVLQTSQGMLTQRAVIFD